LCTSTPDWETSVQGLQSYSNYMSSLKVSIPLHLNSTLKLHILGHTYAFDARYGADTYIFTQRS